MNLPALKVESGYILTQKLYDRFVISLSRRTPHDGRFLVLISVTLYFLFIYISNFFIKYYELWNHLGVPARPYLFGDLWVITSGWECHKLGYDVIVENPCNPWPYYQEVNYPRIWMTPVGLGFNRSHTVPIGIVLSVLFFAMIFVVSQRLNYSEAIIYILILCSPAVMFGVERANNDLIVFIILAVSLLLIKSQNVAGRLFSYFAILFAAILKLYPIFGLAVMLKRKKKLPLITGFLILAIFFAYVLVTLDDIRLISDATPRVNLWSYGCKIIFSLLVADLMKIYEVVGFEKNGFEHYLFYLNYNRVIGAFISGSIFLIWLIQIRYARKINRFGLSTSEFLDGFRLGSSLYVGTFMLGNNWAYRLIFLIFTVPQILSWIKTGGHLGVLSSISLVSIILTLYLKTTAHGFVGVYFDQLIDWYLFFYCIYVLLLTLPDWLKAPFHT